VGLINKIIYMKNSIKLNYEDNYIRSILDNTKTIAMIGLSPSWNRPSYFVAKYLIDRGYKIFPINPKISGKKILGQYVYSKVSEIKEKIDMIDIFRKSADIDQFSDECIHAKPKFIWLQIGIINKNLAILAKKHKIKIVMNRCPKIEYSRLSGELGWAGINSGSMINKRRIIRPINTN